MATSELLTVDYHQQDTDYYCGAANAQMILDSIGAGYLDQDDLYTDCHTHTVADPPGSWFCGPDGLAWTLNAHRDGHALYFLVDAFSTEDVISRKIVWTIHHYKVAPAALVQGGNHWVVVAGYGASSAPGSSGDNSYTINEFVIDNPWPPTPSPTLLHPTPPPHTAGDICGSGGDRGVATEHVSYAGWRTSYMTPNAFGTTWKNQYVAVCDPEPPADPGGAMAEIVHPLGGDSIAIRRRHRARAGGHSHVQPAASQALVKRVRGGGAAAPDARPAAGLDDRYYYIVPFGSEQTASAAVIIDARFGTITRPLRWPMGGPVLPVADGSTQGPEPAVAGADRSSRRVLVACTSAPRATPGIRRSSGSRAGSHSRRSGRSTRSRSGGDKFFVRIDGAIFGALHDLVGGSDPDAEETGPTAVRHRSCAIALGLDDSVPVTTWRVLDLDSTRAYELVVFGDADRSVGVAAIDADDGQAWSWARLPGTGRHVDVGREEARRRLRIRPRRCRARLEGVGRDAFAALSGVAHARRRGPWAPGHHRTLARSRGSDRWRLSGRPERSLADGLRHAAVNARWRAPCPAHRSKSVQRPRAGPGAWGARGPRAIIRSREGLGRLERATTPGPDPAGGPSATDRRTQPT